MWAGDMLQQLFVQRHLGNTAISYSQLLATRMLPLQSVLFHSLYASSCINTVSQTSPPSPSSLPRSGCGKMGGAQLPDRWWHGAAGLAASRRPLDARPAVDWQAQARAQGDGNAAQEPAGERGNDRKGEST